MPARLLSPDLGDFASLASSSSARTASAPSQPPLAPDELDALSDLTELSDDGSAVSAAELDGSSRSGSSADASSTSDAEVAALLLNDRGTTQLKRAKMIWWTDQQSATLRRGLDLIPDLQRRRVTLGGRQFGRCDLLAEYIRRQTGVARPTLSITNRLQVLKANPGLDFAFKDALQGAPTDRATLESIDWNARLGPDFFPHVHPAPHKRRRKPTAQSTAISSRRKKRKASVGNAEVSPPPTQAIPPPSHSSSPSPPDVLNGRTFQPAFTPPQVPTTAPSLFSSSSSPTTELCAFLTSFSPSHDFASSAAALFRAGLAVPVADLASLIFLEPCFFEAFLDSAGARVASEGKGGTGDEMNPYEAAWLRKTLLRARKEATM